MRGMVLYVLAAGSLSACKWIEFDDLQNQTWVTSTQKPDVTSIDYGVAMRAVSETGSPSKNSRAWNAK